MLYLMLGVLCASFTACMAERLIYNQSLTGRSYCTTCHHVLQWYELIPILSFLWQRGRCRQCHAPIPVYLLLCELLGGLFAWQINQPVWLLVAFLLLGLSLQDYLTEHITPFFAWVAFVTLLFHTLFVQIDIPKLIGLVALSIICYICVQHNLLGSGDVPVLLILWLLLPLQSFSWMLIISSVVGITMLKLRRCHQIAFVPCLSCGYWIVALVTT